MRHRDRGGRREVEPAAGLLGEAGRPRRGRVAVDRARRPGRQRAREVVGRTGRDPALVGAGPAEEGVDHVVGRPVGDPGLAGEPERPGHRQRELAGHVGLGIGPEGLGGVGPQAGQHEGQRVVGGSGARGGEQVDRQAHHLVVDDGPAVGPGDPQLRDADRRHAGVVGPARDVGVVDVDLDRRGRAGGEHDIGAVGRVVRRRQVDVLGGAVAELQRGRGDPAAGLRLGDVEVVDREGRGEVDAQVLAADLVEGADLPRRPGIAVDGVGRAVLGRVGHRVAVARGPHRGDADGPAGRARPHDHGLGVGAGVGEDVEPGVLRIVDERLLVGRLGVAGVLAQRPPALGPLAVRVRDDDVGPGADGGGEAVGIPGIGGRVEDRAGPVEETGRRQLHHALAVARHERAAGRWARCG